MLFAVEQIWSYCRKSYTFSGLEKYAQHINTSTGAELLFQRCLARKELGRLPKALSDIEEVVQLLPVAAVKEEDVTKMRATLKIQIELHQVVQLITSCIISVIKS